MWCYQNDHINIGMGVRVVIGASVPVDASVGIDVGVGSTSIVLFGYELTLSTARHTITRHLTYISALYRITERK